MSAFAHLKGGGGGIGPIGVIGGVEHGFAPRHVKRTPSNESDHRAVALSCNPRPGDSPPSEANLSCERVRRFLPAIFSVRQPLKTPRLERLEERANNLRMPVAYVSTLIQRRVSSASRQLALANVCTRQEGWLQDTRRSFSCARRMRAATVSGASIAMSDKSSVPRMMVLPGRA